MAKTLWELFSVGTSTDWTEARVCGLGRASVSVAQKYASSREKAMERWLFVFRMTMTHQTTSIRQAVWIVTIS
jgi:hypothetical protein